MNIKVKPEANPVKILKGLPGSGKSKHLIQLVNAARLQKRPVATFACNESPRMVARDSVRINKLLGCREPGLTCPLDHFASTEDCIKILQRAPKKALVAFEEAHYFSETIVPFWLEAAQRGLEVLVCMPSDPQLALLQKHPCDEKQFKSRCECCHSAEATTFIIVPGQDATQAMCPKCSSDRTLQVRKHIVERLQAQAPYPGQQAIYQPVELQECTDWNVLRPDSARRFEFMTRVIGQTGLLEKQPSGSATYLDIGCNTGYFCHRMHQLGFFSEGVDVVTEDIEVARLLDSYIRRDQCAYHAADAYTYLRETRHRQFDVTSAFAVFQWLMIQTNAERGIACLEWLFQMTKYACFLEMGYSSEEQYRDKLPILIDRDWVVKIMKEKGGFSQIEMIPAGNSGLMRDFFIGVKKSRARVSCGELTAAPAPARVLQNGDQVGGAASFRSTSAEEEDREYRKLLARIRRQILRHTPVGAKLLIASENEDRLINLKDRTGMHFFQAADGTYAGHHPANGAQAVTQLEALRRKGADFLVLPKFSFWWLESYPELKSHLETRCQLVRGDRDCQLYALSPEKKQTQQAGLPPFFDRLLWLPDRLLLDGLVFRLEHFRNDDWELGDECFRLYKTRGLTESLGRCLAAKRGFRPQNVFELGIWYGGSLVFWNEWLRPQKHVIVDICEPRPSAYLERYLAKPALRDRLKCYWRTNQADSARLQAIAANDFIGPFDLVIDDASHLYGPTKASFEALFPLLRPGGLYIIEDWAWGHWEEFHDPKHPWANEPTLTDLVVQLIESTGTRGSPIASVTTHHGFTVIERGGTPANKLAGFKLENYIARRSSKIERKPLLN